MDFSLISQTSLFRGYTPSETEELLRRLRASTRRFVRDSAVYTAGKPVSNIGIVLSGTARSRIMISGEIPVSWGWSNPEKFLPRLMPVCWRADDGGRDRHGRYGNFVCKCPGNLRLASSGKGNYTRLIQNLVIISARKNLTLSRRILHTSSKKIRGRLLSYLSYQAELQGSNRIEIPLNRQQLADYLSLDRSALSKELSRMKSDGLIDYHKNIFTLHHTFTKGF